MKNGGGHPVIVNQTFEVRELCFRFRIYEMPKAHASLPTAQT